MTREMPTLLRRDGRIFLTGITAGPFPLWDESQRVEAARENVDKALAMPDGVTPFLVGIEHVRFLSERGATRPVVVIEPSLLQAQTFLARHPLPENQAATPRVIIGQWGFCSPL